MLAAALTEARRRRRLTLEDWPGFNVTCAQTMEIVALLDGWMDGWMERLIIA